MAGLIPSAAAAAARDAAARIAPHVRRTYLARSAALSEETDAEVFLKLENLQETGAFKWRGALNAILATDASELAAGVVTASTGNHGAAVARAAALAGVACEVHVPRTIAEAKRVNMQRHGARLVVIDDDDCLACELSARDRARSAGMRYVPPYNDAAVIAGQGTVGVELVEQAEGDGGPLDVVFVPVGGGGLAAGVASVVKEAWPACEVVGCSPEASAAMAAALDAGAVVDVSADERPTLADGTAGGVEEHSVTFDLCRLTLAGIRRFPERAIADGMLRAARDEHMLVEGAGALGIAAVVGAGDELRGRRVGVVVSGGNVSVPVLRRVLGPDAIGGPA